MAESKIRTWSLADFAKSTPYDTNSDNRVLLRDNLVKGGLESASLMLHLGAKLGQSLDHTEFIGGKDFEADIKPACGTKECGISLKCTRKDEILIFSSHVLGCKKHKYSFYEKVFIIPVEEGIFASFWDYGGISIAIEPPFYMAVEKEPIERGLGKLEGLLTDDQHPKVVSIISQYAKELFSLPLLFYNLVAERHTKIWNEKSLVKEKSLQLSHLLENVAGCSEQQPAMVYCATPSRFASRKDEICKYVVEQGALPFHPFFAFPLEYYEAHPKVGRQKSMQACFDAVKNCDEFWMFGVSTGTMQELLVAKQENKAIKLLLDFDPDWKKFYAEIGPKFGNPLEGML